jgi:hypothetical protein
MGATVIDHEQPEPEVRLRFKTATCAGDRTDDGAGRWPY